MITSEKVTPTAMPASAAAQTSSKSLPTSIAAIITGRPERCCANRRTKTAISRPTDERDDDTGRARLCRRPS